MSDAVMMKKNTKHEGIIVSFAGTFQPTPRGGKKKENLHYSLFVSYPSKHGKHVGLEWKRKESEWPSYLVNKHENADKADDIICMYVFLWEKPQKLRSDFHQVLQSRRVCEVPLRVEFAKPVAKPLYQDCTLNSAKVPAFPRESR